MSYVVLSTDAAGQQKVEDVESLDDALQLVERLRNDDHVEDLRVLREVPIEVKTYYKVVVLEDDASGGTGEAAEAAASPVEASPDADLTTEPPAAPVGGSPDGGQVGEPVPVPPSGGPGAQAPAAGPGDDGFFTPPPVRSHPIEEDGTPPDDAPSERRTSLFGRG